MSKPLPADPKLSKAMAAAITKAWERQSWYEDLELQNGEPFVQVVDAGGHWSAVVSFRSGMMESPEAERVCRYIAIVAPGGVHDVIVAAGGNSIAQCLVKDVQAPT